MNTTHLKKELKRIKVTVTDFTKMVGIGRSTPETWKSVPLYIQLNLEFLKSMETGDRAKFITEWLEKLEKEKDILK